MCITKLQKLLYALDGGLLARNINAVDEHCRAWQYGPVYPKVFTKINPEDFNKNYDNLNIDEIDSKEHADIIKKMVEVVLDNFGQYSAGKLSDWSHREGSPWSQTPKNEKISKLLMKEYFSR
ncbi:zinc finger/helix-turn-helix protein, YgiT family [Brachyspira suanatina]|uniref:Zinc finger/helix-turn-helix protein, YgiT family n=2 Tax=Brachyspira TaxID=29521 RepID=A0A0G4KA34_9SPIR|nr:type II toxin-antitoxin system antitoxin SocA domain-containing protein [Brachyspira suanatina]CRF35308.1 zinc finger/helix-turn-helix protein, YgiT family [Brachyspira suanatina]